MNDVGPAQQGPVGQWFSEWVSSGKLPGAVKAIAHVVGVSGETLAAAIDIGKAKAEQFSQGIRSETEARKLTKAALASSAVVRMADQPELTDRAIERWVGAETKAQANREGVANVTIEHLRDAPPDPSNPPPDEDWLNVFGDHAAKASSDRLRDLWGRVLAGEIRKPGSFSPSTIHVLAILDRDVAQSFEKLASIVAENKYLIIEENYNQGEIFEIIKSLDAAGLLYGEFSSHTTVAPTAKDHLFILKFDGYGVALRSIEGKKFVIPVIILTKAGREIITILSVRPAATDIERIAKHLKRELQPAVSVTWGQLIRHDNGIRLGNDAIEVADQPPLPHPFLD